MCNKPKIKTTPAPVAAAPVAAPETTGKQSLTIGISNTRGTGLNI